MPAKTFFVERPVQKSLRKLPVGIHQKIINTLSRIQQNPLAGEKLHGELAGYYKYRVGNYRIVHTFDAKKSMVVVVKIEHRQGVYR